MRILIQLLKITMLGLLLMLSQQASATVFNIVPKSGTTLPTQIQLGNSATAYYTVTNTTGSTHAGNYVKTLPPNVSQVTTGGTYADTCGSTFTLAVNQSCTLQLLVTGAVNANDPTISHHLFACLGGCSVCCAGTLYPLNITITQLSGLSIAPTSANIVTGGTQQLTATATYTDGSTGNVSPNASWVSSNPAVATVNNSGVVTGVSAGTAVISANYNGLTSNASTIFVRYQYAYVANRGTNSISVCQVIGGTLNGCTATTLGGLVNTPNAIVFNPSGTSIYIANNGNNTVLNCGLDANRNVTTCNSNSSATFNGIDGMIFDSTGNYFYITNFNNNTVSLCNVNADGSLSACATTGSGFTNPASIRIDAAGAYAYISDWGANSISACAINATTHALTGCASTANGNLANPDGLSTIINGTMFTANNANGNNQIISFSVNNGIVSNFAVAANAASGAPGFNNPDAIDFNAARTYAYISNFAGPPYVVSICQLISSTTLGSCTNTTGSGTFNVAHGVAVQ